ncbi:hypothetical protein E2F47_20815 [Mycobacterium eburneum]|nr:hypothetical protein [Mycobacterium eburneum]TDH49422.1 hypothetical protein E2F47_20815 [Mycobacterium eburneum]
MAQHDASSPYQPDPGDAVNPDVAAGVGAEDVDEERIGLDPLEEGMDPPERWTGSDRFGVSADEQRDGESLEQRLEQEEADVWVDEAQQPEPDLSRQQADEAGGSVARGLRTPDDAG